MLDGGGKGRELRVAHVNPTMELGGVERQLCRLTPYLIQEGIEPLVISSGGSLAEEVVRAGATHVCAPVAGKWPWQLALAARALRDIFRERRPHLVRAHAVGPAIAARWAINTLADPKPPLLLSIHAVYDQHWLGSLRTLLPFVYPIMRRVADHVVTVCEPIKDSLKAHGIPEDMITVIENGINPEVRFDQRAREQMRAECGLNDREPVVGFIGRLVPQKQIHTLVDAAPAILERYPEAVFLVVGGGPLRWELELRVERLGLKNRVRFLGPRANAVDLLSSFDVFVLPSLWEGLSNVLLEAMACARPCVVTAVVGNVQVAMDGETALLVPPRDPAAIAEATIRLLSDRELAQSLGRRAAENVRERFSIARTAQRMAALYRALVDSRRPAGSADASVS